MKKLGPFLSWMKRRSNGRFWFFYAFFTWPVSVAAIFFLFVGHDLPVKLIGVGIWVVWALFIAWRAYRRWTGDRHPLLRWLSGYSDVNAAIEDIESDLGGQQKSRARLKIGERWIGYARGGDWFIQRLDNLTWAYTERITHRLLSTIPYRADYQLRLWDRANNGFAASLSKHETKARLALLGQMLPWLPLGWSDELKESWNADRPEFLAWVDGNRAKYAADAVQIRRDALAAAPPTGTPFLARILETLQWATPFLLLVAVVVGAVVYGIVTHKPT